MSHPEGLSNNPYPEPNQPNSSHWYLLVILILSSHLRLGFPKSLYPVDVPVQMLKALLPSSILATWPAHLTHPDYIRWTVQPMTFLIVQPSPLPSLGLKYLFIISAISIERRVALILAITARHTEGRGGSFTVKCAVTLQGDDALNTGQRYVRTMSRQGDTI